MRSPLSRMNGFQQDGKISTIICGWVGDRLTTRFKNLLDRQWKKSGDRSPDCACGYWISGMSNEG